jgi:MFS family permease
MPRAPAVTIIHPMDPRPSDRLVTPAFIALTLSELAYFTAAGLVIGVSPFFATGPLGSDEAGLGLMAAAFGLTTLLLRPVAGRWADRRGRRPLLVAGAALAAFVIGAHALTDDLVIVLGLRLLLGIGEALFFVAGVTALADLAPPGRTGEALSYNSLALYLGLALGPLLGQLTLDVSGFALAWLSGLGLCLLAALLATRVPETRTTRDDGDDEPAPRPLIHAAALGPGTVLMVGVAAMSAFLLLVGPHAEEAGLDAWSVSFLAFGGVVIVCRVLFARLPDRVSPMPLAGAALGLVAIGLGSLAVVPGITGLLAGTAVLGVGVALMTPAVFAAVFGRVPASERGSAAGTTTLFIDLGFAGGPFLAGYVAASLGLAAAFAVAGAIALSGAVAALVGPGLIRRHPVTARSRWLGLGISSRR